ncbi:hypothetical protein C3L33_21324, partial [Rhododendron williamsianum]
MIKVEEWVNIAHHPSLPYVRPSLHTARTKATKSIPSLYFLFSIKLVFPKHHEIGVFPFAYHVYRLGFVPNQGGILNDPWEEGSVYVLTKLIKATGSDKWTARTAGCGLWHGETDPVRILNKKRRVIGYKRMLRFRIKNGSGAMDENGEGGHWIMHEFSLYGGNGTSTRNKQSPKGSEYVLCRIKKRYDSKDTKKSPKKVKNVEAAASSDADVMVPKPAKRARKEEFGKNRRWKH